MKYAAIPILVLLLTISNGCKKEEDKEVLGCTDPVAENYNSSATQSDNSCQYIFGCTDSESINYNALATKDDGSCEYEGSRTFWIDQDFGHGFVKVYIEGVLKGEISSFYATTAPDCEIALGCVKVTLSTGTASFETYNFTAETEDGFYDWIGEITIWKNDCELTELTI